MTAMAPITGSRRQIVATLREQVRRLEAAGPSVEKRVRSSGCEGLDRLLPEQGFPRGTLIEWLAEGTGSGAGTLAWLAARAAVAPGEIQQAGMLVVLDRGRNFYPPAAAAWGMDWQQIIVVRATRRDDELWACDQALRCPQVAAVWGNLESLDPLWFRRLQLAAESGGGTAHLLRPARVRGGPTWSYAQLSVEPLSVEPLNREPLNRESLNREPVTREPRPGGTDEPEHEQQEREQQGHEAGRWRRRWRVELARCQGAARTGAVELELDERTGTIREIRHETRPLYLAAPVAHPAARRRSAGA